MRKLLFVAVAALTLGLASCSENAKTENTDAVIEELKAQIEAGDSEGVQTALEGAQAKIAELAANDPEAAKTYVAQVQEFINENKEQILAVVGENVATQTLVNTLVDTPAETVINVLTAGQSVANTAENLKDSVEQAINNKAEEMKQGAEDAVKEAVDAQVDAAKKQAADKVNEATQKANEKVNEAAEKTNKEMKDAANKALKSIGL
jgi:hypothetical protein